MDTRLWRIDIGKLRFPARQCNDFSIQAHADLFVKRSIKSHSCRPNNKRWIQYRYFTFSRLVTLGWDRNPRFGFTACYGQCVSIQNQRFVSHTRASRKPFKSMSHIKQNQKQDQNQDHNTLLVLVLVDGTIVSERMVKILSPSPSTMAPQHGTQRQTWGRGS